MKRFVLVEGTYGYIKGHFVLAESTYEYIQKRFVQVEGTYGYIEERFVPVEGTYGYVKECFVLVECPCVPVPEELLEHRIHHVLEATEFRIGLRQVVHALHPVHEEVDVDVERTVLRHGEPGLIDGGRFTVHHQSVLASLTRLEDRFG